MEQEILALEKKVEEMENWQLAFLKQRFKFPLDFQSRDIIAKNNIVFTGKTHVTNGVALTDFIGRGIIVQVQNVTGPNEVRTLVGTLPIHKFTVNSASDVFTYDDGSFILKNNDQIYLTTSGTLPTGLNTITNYYIINATTTTFKVSLTQGGSAVDVTSVGSGNHYFSKI